MGIRQRRLDTDGPFYDPQADYYLISAVARGNALDIAFEAERDAGAEVSATLEDLVEAEGNISVTGRGNAVRYAGNTPLAFGVELFKRSVDPTRNSLSLGIPSDPIRMRAAADERAFLDEEALFVDVAGASVHYD